MTEPRIAPAAASAPLAPERGWSWRLLGPFHVTGVIRAVPSPLLWIPAAIFTPFFFIFLRKIRVAIASNLEPALGPCGWWNRQRRIFRTMWLFGWCLNERFERLLTDRPFHMETEAMEHWNDVARPGRGFVLVTAHIGNFEVGSMMPAQLESRRVHLVREPEADASAQAFLKNVLAGFAQAQFTMHFQSDDPLQGMELLDALRRSEIVAVQGDRPRAGGKTIDAEMFGKPYPLPPGPAGSGRRRDRRTRPRGSVRARGAAGP